MSLRDFKEEFHVKDRTLYAVICISHELKWEIQSPVNHMLKRIETELEGELEHYQEVQTAYVYESPLLEVREFQAMEKNSPFIYKEPCVGKYHNLPHIFFMGMVLLQELQKNNKEGEYRLYLVTDEKFHQSQVRQIVYEQGNEIRLSSVFEDLDFKPVLFKTAGAGGDILETYFEKNKNGEVRLFSS